MSRGRSGNEFPSSSITQKILRRAKLHGFWGNAGGLAECSDEKHIVFFFFSMTFLSLSLFVVASPCRSWSVSKKSLGCFHGSWVRDQRTALDLPRAVHCSSILNSWSKLQEKTNKLYSLFLIAPHNSDWLNPRKGERHKLCSVLTFWSPLIIQRSVLFFFF